MIKTKRIQTSVITWVVESIGAATDVWTLARVLNLSVTFDQRRIR